MPTFIQSVVIKASVERVFAFHEREDALNLLTPAFPPIHVIRKTGGIEPGSEVELEIQPFPGVKIRWLARHTGFAKNRFFEDRQVSGPFAKWHHLHEFVAEGQNTRLTDRVEFQLPSGWLVNGLFGWIVKIGLLPMFRHRHKMTRFYCEG